MPWLISYSSGGGMSRCDLLLCLPGCWLAGLHERRMAPTPVGDFTAAAAEVAGHADLGYRDGASLSQALRELERAIKQRQAWENRAR